MRVVLCNGCFDLLHIGHLRHLEEARDMGDSLVVGLTLDEGIGKLGRPIIPDRERIELLRGLRCVSSAFYCRDSLDALRSARPDIFCKGADYLEKGLLEEEIAHCRLHGIEIRHTKPNPQTTSAIIERIKCG